MVPVLVGLYLPLYRPGANRTYSPSDSKEATAVSFCIAIVGILSSPMLAAFSAPDFDHEVRTNITSSSVFAWLGFLVVSLSFNNRIRLQSEGKNGAAACSSVIFSSCFALVIALIFALDGPFASSKLTLDAAFFFGCLSLLVFYSGFFCRDGSILGSIREQLSSRSRGAISGRLIIGAFLVQLLLSLPRVIDRRIASVSGVGSVSALDYAYNIYTAAGMIVGTSAIIVLAQKLATIGSSARYISTSLRIAWFPILCSAFLTAGILLFSSEIIALVYLRGEFEVESAQITEEFLKWLMPSFVPMLANMLLFQALLGCHRLEYIVWPAVFKLLTKALVLFVLFDENSIVAVGVSTAIGEVVFLAAGFFCLSVHSKKMCLDAHVR